MSATYDLTTDRGKARLWAADTDTASYLFTDAEWDYFLTESESDPMLAAAMALEIAATDAAKIAIVFRNESQTTDPTRVPELLTARAAKLRSQAGKTLVGDRLQVFTLDASDSDLGNLDPW